MNCPRSDRFVLGGTERHRARVRARMMWGMKTTERPEKGRATFRPRPDSRYNDPGVAEYLREATRAWSEPPSRRERGIKDTLLDALDRLLKKLF